MHRAKWKHLKKIFTAYFEADLLYEGGINDYLLKLHIFQREAIICKKGDFGIKVIGSLFENIIITSKWRIYTFDNMLEAKWVLSIDGVVDYWNDKLFMKYNIR